MRTCRVLCAKCGPHAEILSMLTHACERARMRRCLWGMQKLLQGDSRAALVPCTCSMHLFHACTCFMHVCREQHMSHKHRPLSTHWGCRRRRTNPLSQFINASSERRFDASQEGAPSPEMQGVSSGRGLGLTSFICLASTVTLQPCCTQRTRSSCTCS